MKLEPGVKENLINKLEQLETAYPELLDNDLMCWARNAHYQIQIVLDESQSFSDIKNNVQVLENTLKTLKRRLK